MLTVAKSGLYFPKRGVKCCIISSLDMCAITAPLIYVIGVIGSQHACAACVIGCWV